MLHMVTLLPVCIRPKKGFSGRMPCSEIADTIISLAKETLLLAIKTCEKEFSGKVIYGDTDSIFVLFEGKTISEAFQIGKEIAKKVTERNPQPIKLQFEKVYCPLVMVSKKHYAGYKYETPDPSKKILDSKGLELIRRDTCEAVTKICEKIVRIIFDSKDLSKVKSFLYKTFDKIITGKAIIKEFIFAKEVLYNLN